MKATIINMYEKTLFQQLTDLNTGRINAQF